MHDAAESYCGDLNRPLKHYTEAGVAYRRQEAIIQKAIATRFGFSIIEPPSVKLADNSMLYAEKRQLMSLNFEEAENWERYDENNGIVIEPWSPQEAEQVFLDRFEELYKVRVN